MPTLEISLNRKKLCVAEIGENGKLSAMVYWATKGNKGYPALDVAGLLSPADQPVGSTRETPLQIGDEVQIRIVETVQVDMPRDGRRKSPAGRQIGGIIGPY
jgi:hypothetical protein